MSKSWEGTGVVCAYVCGGGGVIGTTSISPNYL